MSFPAHCAEGYRTISLRKATPKDIRCYARPVRIRASGPDLKSSLVDLDLVASHPADDFTRRASLAWSLSQSLCSIWGKPA
jgi:hypothetical protein